MVMSQADMQGPLPQAPGWAVPAGPHPRAWLPRAQRSLRPSESVTAEPCGFRDRAFLLGVLHYKLE